MAIKRLTYAVVAVCMLFITVLILWQYQVRIGVILGEKMTRIAEEEIKTVMAVEQGKREALLRLTAGLALTEKASAYIRDDPAAPAVEAASWAKDDFFPNNNVNFIAWTNLDRKIVFARWYDDKTSRFLDIPPEAAAMLDDSGYLPDSGRLGKTGLITVGGSPLLVASHQIYESAAAGPSPGWLTLGQMPESEVAKNVRSQYGFHMTVLPYDSPEVPPEVAAAELDFSGRDYRTVPFARNGWNTTALVLGDLAKKPSLVVVVETPVDANQETNLVSSRFQAIVFLVALASGVALVAFLGRYVFKPLDKLENMITHINKHEFTLADNPGDLGLFAGMQNGLLNILNETEANNRKMREKDNNLMYRVKLEEALAKVSRNLLRDPDKGILKSLRVLGRSLDTDVVSYWQLAPDRESMHCTGTFRDQVTGEFSGEYDFDAPVADWIVEAIRHSQHTIINNINEIPEDMADVKTFISEYELKSFLAVPLVISGGRLGGLVAFGDIRSARVWKKEDLRALEVVAELFVDMIEKTRKTS